ncbi:PrsW family intramembrane metalloprotease [Nocardia arthritidis]|uniref:PrsW family intramembrane metalloprotease n=1 Tax=Nocardia arthritidis TaxID=228602 RepID=A0A6G9YUP2_9NOCA|nr:PrsW family intramembrane metalloprotease [Nocardia arthritidis]QIS16821.1 PrsW family intramembrane metalloprotease [Nocardia arthritidis]
MRWFQPSSALFWVYFLIVCVGWAGLVLQLLGVFALTASEVLVGLPFTLATLVIFGWVIIRLDSLRARHVLRTGLRFGFLWGAMAGPGIALFGNDHLMRVVQNIAGDDFANDWQAPISATIVEEGIKGIGVFTVAWLGRWIFVRPMHGLLLGGCVGLGFQVVEDLIYEANAGLTSAQGGATPAILVGAVRLVAGIASHWMFTALAGIGIVVAVARRDWSMTRRLGVFAVFYSMGCALHFGWDAPDTAHIEYLGIGLKLVVYVVFFAAVYAWVLRGEREWFRSMIPIAAARGIATPEQLATLITRRSRRAARKPLRAQGYSNRQLIEGQRGLLERMQRLGTEPVDRLVAAGGWPATR